MKRLFQITLLLAGLAWCIPAQATTTFSQVKGNAACGTVSSCAVGTFTAIPVGSLIFERMSSSLTTLTASAGASGAGTWILPSGCTTVASCKETDSTAGAVAVAYILASVNTPTTITCTATTAAIDDCTVAVWTFTGSSMAFDVGAVRDQSTSATSFAGTSAGTLTGTNDVIVQFGTTSGNFSGCPNSSASPADFTNGNALCGLVNSTNNAAGTFTLSSTGRAALGAIAFTEAAAAATNTSAPWRNGPSFAISLLMGILIGVGYAGGKLVTDQMDSVHSLGSMARNHSGPSQFLLGSAVLELWPTPQGIYELAEPLPKISVPSTQGPYSHG